MSQQEFERRPNDAFRRVVERGERVVVERDGAPVLVMHPAGEPCAEPAPGPEAAWQPSSALGKDLMAIRQRYLDSGGTLLSDDEILEEVRDRRGGYHGSEDAPDIP